VARLTRTEQRSSPDNASSRPPDGCFAAWGLRRHPSMSSPRKPDFPGCVLLQLSNQRRTVRRTDQSSPRAEVDTLSRALDRIKSADDLAPAIERRYRVLAKQ